MNEKQATMLRQMKAGKEEIIAWKALSQGEKGKLRKIHKEYGKLLPFWKAMQEIS